MSFYFFFTPFDCNANLPFEILSGHFLDRANEDEKAAIKTSLEKYTAASLPQSRYEAEWVKTTDPGEAPYLAASSGHVTSPLPADKQRYWVIRFEGVNHEQEHLQNAFLITEPGLEIGWAFHDSERFGLVGPMLYVDHTSSFFNRIVDPMEQAPVVAESHLIRTREFVTLLKAVRAEYPSIARAVGNYRSTLHLSRSALFPLLSYFALIESLITHKPDPADPTQSLTRQISRKMILLAKRMEPPLDHREHFPDLQLADPVKFWKTLYGVRSDIAHGNTIDPKQLKLFVSAEKIREFLLLTARSLIRCAVKEPVLVIDLQQC